MSSDAYHIRRATIDDLPVLLALRTQMHPPIEDLERRLTEFYLVEADDKTVLGTLGIEIINLQGRLHSEAFNDFALAETLRDQLWHRIQSLAASLGLTRLWTSDRIPFWRQNGFQAAARNALEKLPEPWTALSSDWLTLQLRDEEALEKTLGFDFEVIKEQREMAMKETQRRARFWKSIAIGLSMLVAIVVVAFSVYLLVNRLGRLRR